MPAVIFARQSYQSKALPAQAQRLLNYFAENNPDNPAEPVTLLGTDGVAASVDLSGQVVRAMQAMGDYLYAVVDTTVWRIDSAGSTTNLGTINDDGNPCRHAHDGTNWVILSGSRGWVATSSTLTEITDADFKDLLESHPDIYLCVFVPGDPEPIVDTSCEVRENASHEEYFELEVPAG